MKILFFISSMEDGGAQRVISRISNALVERSFDVEILKYYKGKNVFELNDKITVNSIEENTHTTNVLINTKWLREYIKNNTDLVISFLAPFNIIALLANNSKPIIVADRNDPRKVPSNKFVRFLRNKLYKKANAIVLQTSANKEYFDNNIKKKSYVIPNPIDVGDYKGIALKTKKEKIIVSVGRLEKQKNQLLLINSFNDVLKSHPDYKLVIYGEGSYRNVLESRINELGINEAVILPGSSKKVFEDMKSAEVFVLSSDYEGMPNALMEAMCIGLPVISTKVSGSVDLIKDETNGMLVELNDHDALTKAIVKVIENKEYSEMISKKAIEINDSLEINNITDEWEVIINSALR